MKVLVTGVGRSGTQYMAAVLSALGLRVGHERIYSHHRHPNNPDDIEAIRKDCLLEVL